MAKSIQIDVIKIDAKEEKLLNQIWRKEYPDCATLEEVVRRLAMQKIKQYCKVYQALNIYVKRRKAGETPEEIFESLKKRELPTAEVEKEYLKENQKKQEPESN